MTTTGPLPAIRGQAADSGCSSDRLDVLARMEAPILSGIWRHYATADAVIDVDRGVLLIACDAEPDPGDWAGIVGLIHAVGWDNGSWPHSDDPGEPDRDALTGVDVFRLEYVRRCVWCHGQGMSYSCPLCGRTS